MADMDTVTFKVNNESKTVTALADTPLLWVLREELKMTGTKFGCGLGQCGACTVHVNGSPTFSCLYPISALKDAEVTTIEGLSSDNSHPVQKAWLAEHVPQCGYCQSGQIMRAAGLLKETPKPTRQQIVEYMSSNICRCGTYQRIVLAIERAAKESKA
jgi:isoquinoline 1-oxidoreductase subunit alpha